MLIIFVVSQEHVIMINLPSAATSANNHFLSLFGSQDINEQGINFCHFSQTVHLASLYPSLFSEVEDTNYLEAFMALSTSGFEHLAATDVICIRLFGLGKELSSLTDGETKCGVN